MAEEEKTRGNELLKAGRYHDAVDAFTRAIELDPTNHIYFSNRSAAYMYLRQYSDALRDAEECVRINPGWAKGYARKAAAHEARYEQTEAEAARKKAIQLGHRFTSASPVQPQPAQSHSGTWAQNTGQGISGNLTGLLFAGRMFTIVNALVYLLSLNEDSGAYQRSLYASIAVNLAELYATHGKPQASEVYLQQVVANWRTHYVAFGLIFLLAHPMFLALVLLIMPEIGHVVDFTNTSLRPRYPGVVRKLDGLVSKAGARLTSHTPEQWNNKALSAKWVAYNSRILDLCASMEVSIIILLLLELFTSRRNLVVLFAYTQFMRIRYILSPQVKDAFRALDNRIREVTGRVPPIARGYDKLSQYLATWVELPTPAQAQARAQQYSRPSMPRCSIM